MNRVLIAVFLFCTTLTALAGDSSDHWFEVKSPNFIVLTNASVKQAAHIASQFEQMRSVFHVLMPNAATDASSPIVVLALKDRKSFQAVEPEAYLAKGQLDLAGYFLQSPDKNYIMLRLDAQGEHPFSTVYHEYTHFMTAKATWMPLWLNEGLAEFYQNTDIYEKEVTLGQPSVDDILYLRQNRLLPLNTLLTVDHNSPYYHEEQKGSVFYSQSWALTHYLIVSDREKKTDRLANYGTLLSKGQDSMSAAQQAFGDLNALQKELQYYVQQGNFKQFRMNTVMKIDESSFTTRAVTTPEADAVRADVLAANGRSKDAEVLATSSLHDDPNNPLAHEVMGYLKFREGDIASAKKWYGEAVQLDSRSAMAHYYFAVMSLQIQDNSQGAAIESSLQTSIKMNPRFAPAYDALAMFYASHDKATEAHLLNIQAVQLEPENLNYRINTATVLSMQRQYPSAIGVLKAAEKVAKTPDETAMLANRIKQLEQFQASLERAQVQHRESAMQEAGAQPGQSSLSVNGTKTMIFRRVDGTMVGTTEDTPKYPAGDATGPRHTVRGVIHNVQCSYPNILALRLDGISKPVSLYSNNYFKVVFTLVNYDQKDDLKPCTQIEGMKASIKYAEVNDKLVDGQILTVDLSK